MTTDDPIKLQLVADLQAAERDPNALITGTPQFVSQAEHDDAKRLAEENEIGIGEAISLAWERDTSVMAAKRAVEAPQFAADESFRYDLASLKEFMKGVPEEEQENLADNLKWAQSADHARWMVERYKAELEQEQKLSTKGWAGVGVRLGMSVLDPGAIALSLATSPLTVAATRLRRALKTAGVAGAENVALERFLESTSQRDNPDGALYAFFGGAVLGGAAGALGRGLKPAERVALTRAADGVLDDLETKALRDAGVDVPPTSRAPSRTDLHADVAAAEIGGKTEAEIPSVRQVLEADASPHLDSIHSRAKELSALAEGATRQLSTKSEALKVLQALTRAGDAEELGSGVSVRRIPKEAKPENLDKLPPEVRALIDANTNESGKVNRKALRELERDVEVLSKEVKTLSNKSTALTKIAELRAARAALKKAEKAKETGVPDADRSVGAAQVRVDELRQEFARTQGLDRELLNEILSAPETAFAGARWDIMARVKSSKNPWTRWIGGRMAEDPVANVNGEALEIGASEIQTHLQRIMETRFYREANPAFNAWAAEKGLNIAQRISRRREFFEDVGRAIREGGAVDANVNKAAKVLRDVFADFLVRAKQARLAGFEDTHVNANYLPRIHASDNVRRLDAIYGTGQVAKVLIQRAIKNEQPDIADDIAEKIAMGYWNRVRKIAAGQTLADLNPRGISLDNRTLVREILEEGNLPKDEIEHVMLGLERLGKDDAGATSRAKSRLLLDETTEVQLKQGDYSPEKPGQVDTVRFSDLLENNAERLFHSYTRQLSGHIALAEKFKAFIEPGESFSRSTFDAAVRHMERWGGDNGLTKEEIKADIDNLEFLWKAVTGAPLEADPLSTYATVTRRIRDFNFIRVMNQVGFAQIAEFGNVLMMGGVRNVMRHLPELGGMLKRAKGGQLEDGLARELEELFGGGTEWVRNVAVTRWDEMNYRLPSSTKVGQTADAAIDVGRRFTAVASGMVPVNTVMQRFTMKAIAQKFVNMANGVEKVSEKRMASLGLDPKMLQRVLKEIKNATVQDGKVLRLNVEKWSDKEALNAFTYAGFRLARRIVQENDVGGMARWMHSSTAKIFLQFRSFMLGAWTKQFLHNIAMNDLQGYSAWAMSMAFGLSAYIAQTHLNAVGRDDREQYLKRRLDTQHLATAAFQRAGASSVLPLAGESVWRLVSDKPLFMGRSTQLPSDLIFGNPTADLTKQTFNALKGVVRAPLFSDYDYSQQDLRALWTILPLQNLVGISHVGNLLSQGLPDTSTE